MSRNLSKTAFNVVVLDAYFQWPQSVPKKFQLCFPFPVTTRYKFPPKKPKLESEKYTQNSNQKFRDFTLLNPFVRMCQRFKPFMKKLRPCCLTSGFEEREGNEVDFEEDAEAMMNIPDDVKEGQVAVVAVKGERRKRFILELGELTNPELSRLLEQAKEEFGFQNKGPLTLPCQPEEVQKILEEQRKRSTNLER